jgi:hypothetical protein
MSSSSTVRDGYADYYAEKLWQLVPEVYRNADGLTANPNVLRQLVEVIAAEVAQTRRSIDRLWEDQHIETCDDWAVPYIGELVGARLVSARDRRGRRVDVANAMYFRRRRGTPEVLDTLVRAMSGWDVVLREGLRHLARMRHRLDALPHPEGPYTATPPGGTADLRRPSGADLADGPFGEYFHTLDTRRLRGLDGRFGVRKLDVHLYPLRAYVLEDSDPVLLQDPDVLGLLRTFTIDPSGRDIPLFIDAEPPLRDGAASTFVELQRPSRAPREWHVTQAMRCRLLGHVRYEITQSAILELTELPGPPTAADLEALGRARGIRFDGESALRRRLRDLGAAIADVPPPWYRELVRLCLVEDTGKFQLYPDQVEVSLDGEAVPRHEIAAGELADRTCQPTPPGNLVRLTIDPDQGRFATVPDDEPVAVEPRVLRYVYGFAGDIGAGPYARTITATTSDMGSGGVITGSGILRDDGLTIVDNRTYTLGIRSEELLRDATLQATPQTRPYVLVHGDDSNPRGANVRPEVEGGTFVVDGGWYGSDDPTGLGGTADFVIEGMAVGDTAAFDFDRIEIRHATFDPGGLRGDGIPIPTLRLRIRAQVRRLVIRRSIVGPIEIVRDAESELAHVEELVVCDSIVDAGVSGGPAIVNRFGTVVLESSTIVGDVHALVLRASDSLVMGQVRVVNNQAGCFRFSASVPGPDTRLPPRYRDVLAPIPRAYFGSLRFGDPQYAQLSTVVPAAIAQGAENGAEMGAFSHLLGAIRLQSVRAKFDEFGPVGMLPQFLFEGDLRALFAVHQGPITPPPIAIEPPPPLEPGPEIPEPPPPAPAPLPTECGDEPPSEIPPGFISADTLQSLPGT